MSTPLLDQESQSAFKLDCNQTLLLFKHIVVPSSSESPKKPIYSIPRRYQSLIFLLTFQSLEPLSCLCERFIFEFLKEFESFSEHDLFDMRSFVLNLLTSFSLLPLALVNSLPWFELLRPVQFSVFQLHLVFQTQLLLLASLYIFPLLNLTYFVFVSRADVRIISQQISLVLNYLAESSGITTFLWLFLKEHFFYNQVLFLLFLSFRLDSLLVYAEFLALHYFRLWHQRSITPKRIFAETVA